MSLPTLVFPLSSYRMLAWGLLQDLPTCIDYEGEVFVISSGSRVSLMTREYHSSTSSKSSMV